MNDFEALKREAQGWIKEHENSQFSKYSIPLIRRLLNAIEGLEKEVAARRNDKLMWVKSNLEADDELAQERQKVAALREALEEVLEVTQPAMDHTHWWNLARRKLAQVTEAPTEASEQR